VTVTTNTAGPSPARILVIKSNASKQRVKASWEAEASGKGYVSTLSTPAKASLWDRDVPAPASSQLGEASSSSSSLTKGAVQVYNTEPAGVSSSSSSSFENSTKNASRGSGPGWATSKSGKATLSDFPSLATVERKVPKYVKPSASSSSTAWGADSKSNMEQEDGEGDEEKDSSSSKKKGRKKNLLFKVGL
jgi:hypothetical protein